MSRAWLVNTRRYRWNETRPTAAKLNHKSQGSRHAQPLPFVLPTLHFGGLGPVNRVKADLALVLITMVWGSTFIIVKSALDSVGPFVFIAARFWVAALGLLAVALVRWRKRAARPKMSFRLLRDGALTGFFLTVAFATQTIGLQTTEAGKAAFITGLSVVLVPFFAAVGLRRPPARAALAGALLAAVGLGLMTLTRGLTFAPGDLWVLACAVGFALHILATGSFSPRHATLPFTLAQLFTVALLSSVAALLLERQALALPPALFPVVLYMGLLATGAIYFTQSWAQQYTTSTHTALIFVLEPVFAALFAAIFAGERLGTHQYLGGALILLGTVVAELGDRRKDEG